MATTVRFADVKKYLDAIADKNKAAGKGNIDDSPHGRFWQKDYPTFISAEVDNLGVPIINKSDPVNSLFYLLLTTTGGSGDYDQMPEGGPYITDGGYQVTIDGQTVTGQQIADNLKSWLGNKYPE